MKPILVKTGSAIFSLLILLLANGCKTEQEHAGTSAPLPEIEVKAAPARMEPARRQIELLGTIEAVHRAEIAAKVSGAITSLPVVLGSEIKKNDLLVEISAGEIDAKVQQSKAQLEQAKRNLEREVKLLRKKAATAETVRSLEESVNIAEAAYQEALTFQNYTRIKAPLDGRVTRKTANVGDLATPGKPLLYIEDNTFLQVLTDIPEKYINRIRQGDRLKIEVPSAEMTITGTIAEVAPTSNPTTRTAPVKLDIQAHPRLHGGQFVRVLFTTDDLQTLTVPREAVLPFGQMERVFVVENNTARLRLVRVGDDHADRVEILSGLRADENVIVEGHHSLRDGQPVAVQ